ncbi:hypothetical protein [Candidatus Erwinia dacicola]|nr:hypothetical protein [Candidatus Erwinia dacicola]
MNGLRKFTTPVILVLSFMCIYYLTVMYFKSTVNADFANSPIVYREFITHGVSALYDWRPTPDSWYFSVYPINFLLFFIMNDDGITPLVLSTVIFTFVIAVAFYKLTGSVTNKALASLVFAGVVFMPQIMYTLGYVQHPFAHNSTSAYGALAFMLAAMSAKNNSVKITAMASLLSFIAISSDMWLAPAYLLPLVFGEIFLLRGGNRSYAHISIYLVVAVAGYLHVLPRIFNIDIQEVKIVGIDQMIVNFKMMLLIIGKTLNIFIIQSEMAWYASFCVWLVLLCYAVYSVFRMSDVMQYVASLVVLSILGISSSYILINQLIKPGSERFFVSLVPCAMAMCAFLCFKNKFRSVFVAVMCLFLATSIASHFNGKMYDHRKYNEFQEYTSFLDRHDLTYGYGEFWHNSIEIDWLTGGRIKIIPVYGDLKYGINVERVRPQTMRSWHTKSAIEKAPKRQFVAFSKGYVCPDVDVCTSLFVKKHGEPSEVLKWKYITLYVYNDGLKFF